MESPKFMPKPWRRHTGGLAMYSATEGHAQIKKDKPLLTCPSHTKQFDYGCS